MEFQNLNWGLYLLLLQSSLFTGNGCVNLPIQLTSSPQNLSIVSQGQSVILTCMTTGSTIISWSSEEYLGRGGSQLSFLSIDHPGSIKNSSITTSFANLTMVYTTNGDTVLESQLHIVDFSVTSTVICYNNDQGVNASITFSVAIENASTGIDSPITVTQPSNTTDQPGPTSIFISIIIIATVVPVILILVIIAIIVITAVCCASRKKGSQCYHKNEGL